MNDYRWHGKYYPGAMRDYRLERAEEAAKRVTPHDRTKRHRLGRRDDGLCDQCGTTQPKQRRRRRK